MHGGCLVNNVACSGDFVILLVRHIQANLKSEIALHNDMDCF